MKNTAPIIHNIGSIATGKISHQNILKRIDTALPPREHLGFLSMNARVMQQMESIEAEVIINDTKNPTI